MTDSKESCPALPCTLRRPAAWLIVSWFVFAAVISAVTFVLPLLFNIPIWGYVAIAILVSIPLGIPTQFAGVWFTEQGITVRSLLSQTHSWSDIDAWTQWGDGGSIFVRTKSGRVFGFDNWCVFNRERQRTVYLILSTYLGPESKGKRAAIPPLLKMFLKSFAGDHIAT